MLATNAEINRPVSIRGPSPWDSHLTLSPKPNSLPCFDAVFTVSYGLSRAQLEDANYAVKNFLAAHSYQASVSDKP